VRDTVLLLFGWAISTAAGAAGLWLLASAPGHATPDAAFHKAVGVAFILTGVVCLVALAYSTAWRHCTQWADDESDHSPQNTTH
jgi:hypothetical protein